ncbi:hypothetical protein FQN57_001016 [Myotisia sp. PD_48]|nr:hypothetical protein FQN57_001016 [Myotisia sp. PD_48]
MRIQLRNPSSLVLPLLHSTPLTADVTLSASPFQFDAARTLTTYHQRPSLLPLLAEYRADCPLLNSGGRYRLHWAKNRHGTYRRSTSTTAGNETNVPVPDSLVASPVLLRRAKAKHRREKVKDRSLRSKEFETDRTLASNPWALALASPPRICRVTEVRQPSELLLDFGSVEHPQTGASWILPITGLQKENLKAATSVTVSPDNAEGNTIPKPTSLNPLFRTVFSHQLAEKLSRMANRALIRRIVRSPSDRSPAKSYIWRKDMPDHILGLLRAEAIKSLKEMAVIQDERGVGHPRGSLTALNISNRAPTASVLRDCLEHVPRSPNASRGIVLIVNSGSATRETARHDTSVSLSNSSNPSTAGPESQTDCSTIQSSEESLSFDLLKLPWQASQVLVLHLSELFGEDELHELSQTQSIFQEKALFFIPNNKQAALLILSLWRLKLYNMKTKD